MGGDQLVLCDIDQQICLFKHLDNRREDGGNNLHRCGGRVVLTDEDAGVVVLGDNGVREGSHVLDTNVGFR